MKITKILQAAFLAVFLCLTFTLSGCQTFESLGDYLSENPVFASVSFRYATAKYIERGDTTIDRRQRQNNVIETGAKVKAFIEANPTIAVSSVMQYLDAVIDWGKLDTSDRILVQEIITIVEADLLAQEAENPLVNLKELLETIINAAILYG